MSTRPINKKILFGGLILIVSGISGAVYPFISFGVSDDYVMLREIAEYKTVDFPDVSLPSDLPDPNLPNITDRIVIGGIGVDMPIFASDDEGVLLKGGWIYPGTALPGQKGNSVIFGHRFRYVPPVSNTFYALDKVKIGDVFTVAWQGKPYFYRITEKKVIEPNDFSVLEQGEGSKMTLITCTPLFSVKQRLVVVGNLI